MPRVGEMMTTWGHSACAGLHSIPFSPKHHLELSSERGKSKNISWWDVAFQVGGTGQHSHLTDRSLNHAMQSQAAHSLKNPSKTHPEDAGETGQDPQGEDGGTGFHAAGPTDVAQRGLAAAGGDSGYADVQVNCWAKCRTFLGDSLVPVIAWSGRERKQQEKSSFSSWIFFFFFCRFQS